MASEILHDYRDIPEDVRADLILLDTPWNETTLGFDKAGFDLADLAGRCQAWLKPNGWLLMFGTVEMAAALLGLFRLKFDYIWLKANGPPLRSNTMAPMRVHETIYAFIQKDLSKMTDLYMDKEAMRTPGKPYSWKSTRTNSEYKRAYGHTNIKTEIHNPGYRAGKSVLKYYSKAAGMPKAERTGHPTQKPLALIKNLIKWHCPPDGLVLDPTLGSGTSAVAAKAEGRAWQGAESNPEYRDIISARLRGML